MAVQKCIHDALGHCVRTVIDVMREPPPAVPAFGQLHVAMMCAIALVALAFLLPVFRNVWGYTHGPAGKLAICVVFAFIGYGSICLTVFGLNHGFRSGQLSASIDETNQDLRAFWGWVHGG